MDYVEIMVMYMRLMAWWWDFISMYLRFITCYMEIFMYDDFDRCEFYEF